MTPEPPTTLEVICAVIGMALLSVLSFAALSILYVAVVVVALSPFVLIAWGIWRVIQ